MRMNEIRLEGAGHMMYRDVLVAERLKASHVTAGHNAAVKCKVASEAAMGKHRVLEPSTDLDQIQAARADLHASTVAVRACCCHVALVCTRDSSEQNNANSTPHERMPGEPKGKLAPQSMQDSLFGDQTRVPRSPLHQQTGTRSSWAWKAPRQPCQTAPKQPARWSGL